MVNKTVVVLCLICVVLAVGLVGALMLLNQKDAELQTKTNQISELENEKLSLASQVSTLQTNVSSLQNDVTVLENEKSLLEADVLPLQAQVSSLQTDVAALANEKSILETQVSPLQVQVSSLESDVTSLTNEKASLQAQVSGLQTEVTSLEGDKSALEQQVSALQTNAESLQTQVESLESEKASLETQVASLVTEVANLEAEVISSYNVGYDDGYAQGADDLIQTGYYYMDPTYDEAIAFIDSDETDENQYIPDYYVCYDFTADFNSNAAQTGYRCGFVYIEFDHSAHAIACFNTTDMGLIYVEPQNDEIVDVAVGQSYNGHIIVKMGIIW